MSGRGTSILVVEDESDILDLVLRHMRANDFAPDGFTDPLVALEAFKIDPNRYAAVLTDIRMHGMSGIELARRILRTNPQTKIVLMTAYDITDDQLGDLPVIKVEDIIKKPFKLTEICSRMKKYVRAS
jgi:DNA-binding response OmpR family regulator